MRQNKQNCEVFTSAVNLRFASGAFGFGSIFKEDYVLKRNEKKRFCFYRKEREKTKPNQQKRLLQPNQKTDSLNKITLNTSDLGFSGSFSQLCGLPKHTSTLLSPNSSSFDTSLQIQNLFVNLFFTHCWKQI